MTTTRDALTYYILCSAALGRLGFSHLIGRCSPLIATLGLTGSGSHSAGSDKASSTQATDHLCIFAPRTALHLGARPTLVDEDIVKLEDALEYFGAHDLLGYFRAALNQAANFSA
jgi:hypothetical protein